MTESPVPGRANEAKGARIRPFRPGDEAALDEICLRTADGSEDATGLYSDDGLVGVIFVLPYVEHLPEHAWVVEAADGRVVGYIVGAPDTRAFDAWFHDEWWPRYHERFPRPEAPATEEERIIAGAWDRGVVDPPSFVAVGHPAHLHINLLPEAQGQGFGTALVETLMERFQDDGVPGVHLGAHARNTGAAAFYPKVGFTRLPSPDPGTLWFVRTL